MKRDFSESSKANLLGLVEQVESEKICNFTDWVGDRWYDFEEWIGALSIKEDLSNIDSYHKKVIDKNNAAVSDIERIFENVGNIDVQFSQKLQEMLRAGEEINRLLLLLSETITPSGEDFRMIEINPLLQEALDAFELRIEVGHTNIFDGSNGYGGDQGDMAYNHNGVKFLRWVWGEDKDIYNFIRQQDGYENYSETQIYDLINNINSEGCGYVALVNTIFSEFSGTEQEFEETFGFPMYDKDGHFNYNLMLADIYCRTDDKYFLTETNGKMAYANEIVNRYRDKTTKTIDMSSMARDYGLPENASEDEIIEAIIANVGGEVAEVQAVGTNPYTMENRLRAYFSEKGIKAEINCNPLSNMTTDDVHQSIEAGKMVDILLTNGAKMYDTNGNQVQVIGEGNHHVIITGLTDDGRYRVSSWGKEYLVDSSSNIGYYVILDVVYK